MAPEPGDAPDPAEAVPWDDLRARAHEVAQRAHARYSGLRVGAAGLCASGEVVLGCNVENASYGLTLCAECGLVSEVARRGLALRAVAVQSGNGRLLTPCGRCRQILLEIGGPDLLVDAPGGPTRIADLLLHAFVETDIDDG